jgi:oligosaccharyltransferase complex subunit epsilon
MDTLRDISVTLKQKYSQSPTKLKVLDCFLVFAALTAAIQFLYAMTCGSFPFNSFLAGFFCALGFFVLTVCLRMQIDPENKDFGNISPERAFADYVLCACLLFGVTWNYMG